MRTATWATILAIGSIGVVAQRPQLSDATRAYVTVDAAVIALTNVRVIDGTGAPARDRQTILIQDGTPRDWRNGQDRRTCRCDIN